MMTKYIFRGHIVFKQCDLFIILGKKGHIVTSMWPFNFIVIVVKGEKSCQLTINEKHLVPNLAF